LQKTQYILRNIEGNTEEEIIRNEIYI